MQRPAKPRNIIARMKLEWEDIFVVAAGFFDDHTVTSVSPAVKPKTVARRDRAQRLCSSLT